MSCLGIVCDKDPNTTNDLLNSKNAFADSAQVKKSLVNWLRVHLALPLKFVQRVRSYDNEKVLAAIKKNGFCLVEVDGSPIGAPRVAHWVVFIGNKLCIDPWDGKTKSTAVYAGKNGKGLNGYCELKRI